MEEKASQEVEAKEEEDEAAVQVDKVVLPALQDLPRRTFRKLNHLHLRFFSISKIFQTEKMSLVQINNVVVLNNPAMFTSPLQFEITFDCMENLEVHQQ